MWYWMSQKQYKIGTRLQWNTNRNLHTPRPAQRCKFDWSWVTLSDSKIFNDTMRYTPSLQELCYHDASCLVQGWKWGKWNTSMDLFSSLHLPLLFPFPFPSLSPPQQLRGLEESCKLASGVQDRATAANTCVIFWAQKTRLVVIKLFLRMAVIRKKWFSSSSSEGRTCSAP